MQSKHAPVNLTAVRYQQRRKFMASRASSPARLAFGLAGLAFTLSLLWGINFMQGRVTFDWFFGLQRQSQVALAPFGGRVAFALPTSVPVTNTPAPVPQAAVVATKAPVATATPASARPTPDINVAAAVAVAPAPTVTPTPGATVKTAPTEKPTSTPTVSRSATPNPKGASATPTAGATATVLGQPHLVVPYTLTYNDGRFLSAGWSAADFLDLCRRGFDYLWDEGESHPKMMSIGLHPRTMGQAGRASALAEFIEYALARGAVWFARRRDIADWWRAHYPPGGAPEAR